MFQALARDTALTTKARPRIFYFSSVQPHALQNHVHLDGLKHFSEV